jgi:hypothetical protein
VGGVRWIVLLTLAATVFGAMAGLPWVIESANYPHKDYHEVLRLVQAHPWKVSSVYGSIGVIFLLWQMLGVLLVGVAAIASMAVLGANVLAVTALLNETMEARFAGFRSHPLFFLVWCLLLCSIGVWITSGHPYRLAYASSYERDRQDPQVFEVARKDKARKHTIEFRVDEPAVLEGDLIRKGAKKPRRHWEKRINPGSTSLRFKLPEPAKKAYVLSFFATDESNRRSRRIRRSYPARN